MVGTGVLPLMGVVICMPPTVLRTTMFSVRSRLTERIYFLIVLRAFFITMPL